MLPLHYATFFDVVPVMEILLKSSGSAGIIPVLFGNFFNNNSHVLFHQFREFFPFLTPYNSP